MIQRTLTAEEFDNTRFELFDGGQWAELIAGEAIALHPPAPEHGPTVLNISKALAEYQNIKREGYACFELGLIVKREPDTVLAPAISYFVTGDRWEELDKTVTETRPALIVEVVSTPDRRRNFVPRLKQYLNWGVVVVWEIDPEAKTVVVHRSNHAAERLTGRSTLMGSSDWNNSTIDHPILQSFSVSLSDVFYEREW